MSFSIPRPPPHNTTIRICNRIFNPCNHFKPARHYPQTPFSTQLKRGCTVTFKSNKHAHKKSRRFYHYRIARRTSTARLHFVSVCLFFVCVLLSVSWNGRYYRMTRLARAIHKYSAIRTRPNAPRRLQSILMGVVLAKTRSNSFRRSLDVRCRSACLFCGVARTTVHVFFFYTFYSIRLDLSGMGTADTWYDHADTHENGQDR